MNPRIETLAMNGKGRFDCPACGQTATDANPYPYCSRCSEEQILDALASMPSGCPDAGEQAHDSRACLRCTVRHDWIRAQASRALADAERAASGLPTAADLMRPGGSLVLDSDPNPVPVWGEGSLVLMAEGESLMVLGGAGGGKTTLAQQWTLGRCGIEGYADLLGLPIAAGSGRVLYLAMDRPQQAIRSMRRMVTEEMREALDERLRIWPGPPPVALTQHPDALTELCVQVGADSVVVDSLKDAGSVVDDDGGTGWNAARQRALVAGIAVLELHHPRKDSAAMPELSDAYGSTWLTAGAGSVLGIAGKPGHSLVKVEHLKQPADPVGPFKVMHDHAAGRSTVWDEADLLGIAARPEGITAQEAAVAIFEVGKPDANQKQAARRRLQSLEKQGALEQIDPGDRAANRPARWALRGGK